MESVGIFECNFDPPTLAHSEIIKKSGRYIDEMWVRVNREYRPETYEWRYQMAEIFAQEHNVKLLPSDDTRSALQLFRDLESENPERRVYFLTGVDNLPILHKRNPHFFNEVKFLVWPSGGYEIPEKLRHCGNFEVVKEKITPMQSSMVRRALSVYTKHYTNYEDLKSFMDEFGYLSESTLEFLDDNKSF